MRNLKAAGLVLLLSASANTQIVARSSAGTYHRTATAGYPAALHCSGIFNAGRTPAQIDADEMTDIYPQYDKIVPTLAASLDRDARSVTVAFDAQLPSRRAMRTSGHGCTTLPIGSTAWIASRLAAPPSIAGADPRRWPQGDAGIAPHPSARLVGAVDKAFGNASGAGTKTVGVIVVKDGRVLAEQYGSGFGPFMSNRIWSVGKSIAGTVIGLAYAGLMDALAFVPQWKVGDPRQAIKLDNLLRMTSGVHSRLCDRTYRPPTNSPHGHTDPAWATKEDPA